MQEIMGDMGNLIILVTSSLFLCLLLALIKILHKLWWTPMRIQCQMNSQGIKGPSYRFIYGNTKEIIKLRKGTLGQNPWLLCHMTYFPKFSLMFTYGSINMLTALLLLVYHDVTLPLPFSHFLFSFFSKRE